MKRAKKGEFGYIDFQKKWSLIRTALFFLLCALVFLTGYITTGSRKNLLTIVAILGCLPACKSAVNVVMFYRAKGCSKSLLEAINGVEGKFYQLFDLYMTSYKTNYAISHMVIVEKTLIGITEDKNLDVNAAQNHIQEHLKQDGYKDMTVKIYNDVAKYTERLDQVEHLDYKPLAIQDSILEMLLAISL